MRVALALLLILLTGCASAPSKPCPVGETKVLNSRCSSIPGCAGDRLTTKRCGPDGKWVVIGVVECSCG